MDEGLKEQVVCLKQEQEPLPTSVGAEGNGLEIRTGRAPHPLGGHRTFGTASLPLSLEVNNLPSRPNPFPIRPYFAVPPIQWLLWATLASAQCSLLHLYSLSMAQLDAQLVPFHC